MSLSVQAIDIGSLLAELRERGVEIALDGDQLALRAPAGVLSGELREHLVRHKSAVIEHLRLQLESDAAAPQPLSHGQRMMWFASSMVQRAIYNYGFAARVRNAANLDASILERTMEVLVERHAALRTTFSSVDGELVQQVHRRMKVDSATEDAAGWDDDRAAAWLQDETYRPFDLGRGPLLRVRLALRGRDAYLLIAFSHIVLDLWSLQLLLEEIHRIYPALAAGALIDLPPTGPSYFDFVRWQNALLAGPEGERQWGYWRRELAGELPLLQLPTDRPHPARPSYRSSSHSFALDAELTAQLRTLARDEGVTFYTALLTLFQMQLHRWSGQRDLLVGTVAAGRNGERFARTVGYFVNPVTLRADFSARPSFRDLLEHTRDKVLAAIEHQDYPFSNLVERLAPTRDAGRPPLFQVGFMLEQPTDPRYRGLSLFTVGVPGARLEIGGLEMESLALERRALHYELLLMVEELDGRAVFSLQYSRDLFDASTAARLARGLVTLAAAAVAHPELAVAELPVLDSVMRHQLLVEWNATAAPSAEQNLQGVLRRWACERPDAIAVQTPECRWSYRHLDRWSDRLATVLRRAGVSCETLVGVCCERRPEWYGAFLAILKADGTYLPLEPSQPDSRLMSLAEASDAALLLGDEGQRVRFAAFHERWLPLSAGETALAEGDDAISLPESVSPDQLAYVIFTSGSTGGPKGVMVPHRGIFNLGAALATGCGIDSEDRVLQLASASFDASIAELAMTLVAGAALCLADRYPVRPGPDLVAHITDLRASAVIFPPAVMAVLSPLAVPSLAKVISAGEACTAEIVRSWSPGRRFFNAYGPTEVTVCSSFQQTHDPARATDVGRPFTHVRDHLLDAALQPVPIGVPGEICVGGIGVTRGYLGRPGQTAERFVPDPLGAGEGGRLYRTGDLGRHRGGGEIEYLGRRDAQVKIRGCRIELGEIEEALRALPKVREAVIVPRHEHGELRLVAYVVGPEHPEILRGALREQLPELMVPSAFVGLERMPTTVSGKIDRAALPAPKRSAAIRVRGEAEVERTVPAPSRRWIEKILADAWCEVLGLDTVDLEENFFEIGGHSLLVVRLHELLAERLGREVGLVDLFEHSTVASLASHLGEAPAVVGLRATRRVLGEEPAAVAIIGATGRFPGAADLEEFWENLAAGRESISVVAGANGGPIARAGGVLEGIEFFDAAFFGIHPRDAERMDPQHRLFLEAAWQVMENAGYDPGQARGEIGVFAGAGLSHYLLRHLLSREGDEALSDFPTLIGNDGTFVPTRVSYKLDLRGPSVNVQTACSTSLVAVALACQSLIERGCDMALAGGVSIRLPQELPFRGGGILSPEGRCRAFAAGAKGTVAGNGLGIVALKRLSDALADGDRIEAVIRGWAINNDGAAKAGYTAPSVEGQARAIAQAHAMAGFEPGSISYVETHGSGTELGDPIELTALGRAFGPRPTACAIGSVKTNIGHLDTAAGVASLLKTVLALRHRQLPPSLHFDAPNPRIDFARLGFRVQTELGPWESSGPLRAGVSAFGIGGTNAHLVLEEAPPAGEPREAERTPRPWQLLTLAARTSSALETMTDRLAEHLALYPETPLSDVAYTLHVGRKAMEHRRLVVCRDAGEAHAILRERDPRRLLGRVAPRSGRPVAFLFPGLGDHYRDMGRGLYRSEAGFRTRIDRCAELLAPYWKEDLREVLYTSTLGDREDRGGDGPPTGGGLDLRALLRRDAERDDGLDRPTLIHPAIFATEYALGCLWLDWGIEPEALMGYSLGELVAACLADVISLEDALRLVLDRARLIEELPRGAMLGAALTAEEAEPLLGDGLSLAAVNGVRQCVIAGPAAAVDDLAAKLAAREVAASRLRSGWAFHSQMMEPLREPLRQRLEHLELRSPRRAVLSTLTGDWLEAEEAVDPDRWARHLSHPVRFRKALDRLFAQPETILLELGPGHTLSSIALQEASQADIAIDAFSCLPHLAERRAEPEMLAETLGKLWLSGAEPSWEAYHAGVSHRRVELPTYPFERHRYWIDPGAPAQPRPIRPSMAKEAIDDWFYVPTWRPVEPQQDHPESALAHLARDGAAWLIFCDPRGLGERLAGRLRRAGCRVAEVHPAPAAAAGTPALRESGAGFFLDPRARSVYHDLVAALRRRGPLPRRIVHLWSLENRSGGGGELADILDHGFWSLVRCGGALAGTDVEEVRVWLASSQLWAVRAGDSPCVEKATLVAPLEVLPQEMPQVTCYGIDFEPPDPGTTPSDDELRQLLATLATPAPVAGQMTALRGGSRYVRVFERRALTGRGFAERLHDGGVYLITGGTGHLGRTLAEHMARVATEQGRTIRLLLLGRTAADEPRPALQRSLERIAELGCKAHAVAADVADTTRLRGVLAGHNIDPGQLRGVIHAAGIVGPGAFRPIGEISEDDLNRQLRPKLGGLYALEEILRERAAVGERLDFLLFTSSLSPILGGLGFVAYAAANACLDAFAHRVRDLAETCLSVNWADWGFERDDKTEGSSIGEALSTSGLGATIAGLEITPEEGAETFERLLASYGVPQVVVSSGDLEARLDQWVRRKEEAAAPQTGHSRPALLNRYVAPRDALEEAVARVWRELLGIAQIGVHDNFFQLGGHSLVGTELFARLRRGFSVDLPLRLLFEAPTVSEMAEALRSAGGTAPGNEDAAPASVAEGEEIVPDVAGRFEPFPLTDIQTAYWVGRSAEFELGNVASHGYLELETTTLDVSRLDHAWRRVIERHDMLRAVILPDGRQQVLPEVPSFGVTVEDLRRLECDAAQKRLAAARTRLSHQILPADRPPLCEMHALLLQDGRMRLCFSFDLLIGDVRSLEILFRDLSTVYRDPGAELPPLRLTFRDCVLAERARRASAEHARALAYWRARLPRFPGPPELPFATAPDQVAAPRFVRRSDRFSAAVWERLREVAGAAGLTASGLLLAAFAEIVRRWSKEPRFVLNVTVFSRPPIHPEIDEVIGDFTSLDMLEVEDGGTFEQRAKRLQERLWSDLEHRSVSGIEVLRELAKLRGGAGRTLMPVVFTSNLIHEDVRRGGEMFAAFGERIFTLSQTPQVWLDHQVAEENGELVTVWDAVEELFPEGLLDAMVEAHRQLLEGLVEVDTWRTNPDLLPRAQVERRSRANATDAEVPAGLLHTGFFHQARCRPDQTAVITPERQLSYGELARKAICEALRLHRTGARPGRLVAVVMDKGWEQVVAVLAILRSGGAYLPIDPELPQARRHHLLAVGEVEVVLTQPRWEATLEWPDSVRRLVVSDDAEDSLEEVGIEAVDMEDVQSADDLAYVIFTSGSTGEPKGVMIEHRAALNTVDDINERLVVGPEDRVLGLSSLSFDLSVYDVFGLLAAGGALVLSAPTRTRDPAEWARLIREHQVTLWNSVPALFEALIDYLETAPRQGKPALALRSVLLSGDWIPLTLPFRAGQLMSAELLSLGGATEGSIWSIAHPIREVAADWSSIPYGRPLRNQRFHVLNEDLEPCPDWVPGQLYIAGVGLARGYWRDARRTSASFFEHPRSGERLYRTGDLGRYLPNGVIQILGREDFQVKIQGYRIELGEIEAVLHEHPSVRSAVVVARGDARGAKSLVAYVVSGEGAAGETALREHLTAKLPAYMVPAAIAFLDALPLNTNGKVDRTALPELGAAAPVLEKVGRPSGRVAVIVAETLGVEQVDLEANLLQLGATSLDLLRIVNRIEQELGERPPLDQLYINPTVSAIAAALAPVAAPQPSPPSADVAEPASYRVMLDPEARGRFKSQRLGLRELGDEHEATMLPAPPSDVELKARYLARRSHRQFDPVPLELEHLAGLLACLRPIWIDGEPKYLYGSAGGLYPVQTYVYIRAGRVLGLAGGAYYYSPTEHRLITLTEGVEIDPQLHSPFVNRRIFEQAAFSLFLVVELDAIGPMYGDRSLRYATLEAGLMAQLLETEAPDHRIGLCQIGELRFDPLRQLFALGESHVLVHCLLGGGVANPAQRPLSPVGEDRLWDPTAAPVEPVLAMAPREVAPTVSVGQRSLWLLHQLAPANPFYNIFDALRLRGPLDVHALEQGLAAGVARHAALRSRFLAVDGEPQLSIAPASALSLPQVDLSTLAKPVREQELERIAVAEARRPFDLAAGGLLRVFLARLGDREHALLLTVHHIVADAWSMVIFVRDLLELYGAGVEGRTVNLPQQLLRYTDYAYWQLQVLNDERLAEGLSFWRRRLVDVPALLELPTDRPRQPVQAFRGALCRVPWEGNVGKRLEELGRSLGATPFVLVASALLALLHHLTGRHTLLVGSAVAGRNRREIENLVGYFVNMVVLRVDLQRDPSWHSFLDHVRNAAVEAVAYQDVPFEKGVEETCPERSASYTPIFQVALVMQDQALPRWSAAGLDIEPIVVHNRTTKSDLTLLVRQGDGAVEGSFEYDTDLFDPTTVMRWGRMLSRLLSAQIDEPDAPMGRAVTLSAAERHQVSIEWSGLGNVADDAGGATIDRLIGEAPGAAPAVVFCGRSLSYSELIGRSRLLARRLQALGVASGVRVAILIQPSFEMVIGILGVLEAGGAYVPVDPTYPAERCAQLLAGSGAQWVLVAGSGVAERELPSGVTAVEIDAVEVDAQAEGEPPAVSGAIEGASPEDPAYMIFTSGSTGGPKGVVVPHRQLVASTRARRQIYRRPPGRFLLLSSFAFDSSVVGLFWTLSEGGTLVLPESGAQYDLGRLLQLLKAERITHLLCLPALYSLILDDLADGDLPELETVIVAGEACPGELVARHIRMRPGRLLYNEYGPTENTVWSTVDELSGLGGGPTLVPIGRPVPGVEVRLLDTRQQPVGIGIAGEILLGGALQARGYHARPKTTSERFCPDPLSAPLSGRLGARLYQTGDLARFRRDGRLDFLGRRDHQIKIRGFRIELAEIEEALLASPLVRETVVVAQPDPTAAGHHRLVGYVALQDGADLDPETLRDSLRERLPNYMVPAAVSILTRLPRTPNGKVDRDRLPALEVPRPERGRVARSRTETILCRVWAETLGVDAIGIDDNFFSLGGDSILAIRMVARAVRAGLKVGAQEIFRHQTVAELATALDSADPRPLPILAEPLVGPVPLTPIQRWFFRLGLDRPHHWNQALVLELAKDLDPVRLAAALRVIEQHHDMLRARFVHTPTGWSQEVSPPADGGTELTRIDLTHLGVEAPVARCAVIERLQASLDLGRGPLQRTAWIDLPKCEPAELVWIVHHLLVDGVSWRILLDDLQRLLEESALPAGDSLRLPPRSASYRDWAERLEAEVTVRQGEKERWRQPAASALRLPREHDGGNLVATAAHVEVRLGTAETRDLATRVVVATGARLPEIVLSAVLEALASWLAAADGAPLAIELEGHGRVPIGVAPLDLSRTVGWMTALYPTVFELRRDRGALLAHVKNTLRGIPDGGVGYSILRELGEDPDLLARETPEVLFNYLGQFTSAGSSEEGCSCFHLRRESVPASRSGHRIHLLEINSSVLDGSLAIEFGYSSTLHRRETIAALADRVFAALRGWIEVGRAGVTVGRTPADFPLADLDQDTLEQILAELGAVEDIYTLAPLQEGILFHTLYDPQAGEYVMQLSCELGGLDSRAWHAAWQRAVDRHPILRTGFFWEGLDAPLQVVFAHAEVTLVTIDLRTLTEGQQRREIARFLSEDYRQGFDMTRAPLLRLALLRLSEEVAAFVWTGHHLLLDGWSLPLLLGEVFTAYAAMNRGDEPAAPPVTPYRDYIGWLARLDPKEAERYWRTAMAGFREPTPLGLDRVVGPLPPGEEDYQVRQIELSQEESSSLRGLSRRHQLTSGTLLQGAWALQLGHLSKQGEVVFGTAVSGRPPELTGSGEIVGLLLNTLPVRVSLPSEAPWLVWLNELQERLADARAYELTALSRIQELSEIAPPTPLFESFLTFQNYPVEESLRRLELPVAMQRIRWRERASFPLTFVIVPDLSLRIECQFSRRRFLPSDIDHILANFATLLREFLVAAPETPLRHFSERLTTVAEERQKSRQSSFREARQKLFNKARNRGRHNVPPRQRND